MKLSLKIVAQHLTKGNVHIACTRRNRPDQMRLTCAMLFNRGDSWNHAAVYLIEPAQLRPDFQCPSGIALIVLGSADPELFAHTDADVLIWEVSKKEMNYREQVNQISGIFRYYQELELKLLDRLVSNGPLRDLVSLGETLFQNPVLLLDDSFSMLIKTRGGAPLDWELSSNQQMPTLSPETVELIRMSGEFRSRDSANGLFYLSGEVLNCGVLFIQVRKEQVSFYIAVLETEHPLSQAHFQLLEYFSGFVFQGLRSRRFSKTKTMYFQEFLGRMLLNEKVEPHEISRQLSGMQWKNDHHYVCFVAELDLWNQKDTHIHSICRTLENRFPGCVSFFNEDRITCVLNLDQAGLKRDIFLQLLSPYVRDQLIRVGVSYEFSDFAALSNYYQQALAALEFGKKHSPSEWSYRFEKYALDYFTRYGTSKMDGRYLCHPDLITLSEYDRDNHTDLLRTFQVYLSSGQNATTTATSLYIHRNTLYQRMAKIDSLIQSNLNNPETRLFMQISFSLMDQELT